MSRMVGVGMIVVVVVGVSAVGQVQIPRRYEIVQLTDNPYREDVPAIDNHGHIVFERRVGPYPEDDEIFLYDDGELIRLTDDVVQDMCPQVSYYSDECNELQLIVVWSRRIGADDIYGPTLEVVVWKDGDITRLTHDDVNDYVGGINTSGHAVWCKWIRGGCHDANAVICFYDGSTIEQISDADWSHQAPAINDHDWIVWARLDFCQEPWWDSEIMLYADGDIRQVSGDESYEPTAPDINNLGQVVWQTNVAGPNKGIVFWGSGVATLFIDWGSAPHLNDRGDICFFRWYEEEQTYQQWLYLKGDFYQLSDDPFWNVDGDINNAGEVVWSSGDYPWQADIRLLQLVPPDGLGSPSKAPVFDLRPVDP